jgi:hypothetical protein
MEGFTGFKTATAEELPDAATVMDDAPTTSTPASAKSPQRQTGSSGNGVQVGVADIRAWMPCR